MSLSSLFLHIQRHFLVILLTTPLFLISYPYIPYHQEMVAQLDTRTTTVDSPIG